MYLHNNSLGDLEAFGSAALPLNTWSYVAGTYDGANLRLYVNGTQVANVAVATSAVASTNPLRIGGDCALG